MIGSETSYEACHDPEHESCVIIRVSEVITVHVPMFEVGPILRRQAEIDSQFHERERERRKIEGPRPARNEFAFHW